MSKKKRGICLYENFILNLCLHGIACKYITCMII